MDGGGCGGLSACSWAESGEGDVGFVGGFGWVWGEEIWWIWVCCGSDDDDGGFIDRKEWEGRDDCIVYYVRT